MPTITSMVVLIQCVTITAGAVITTNSVGTILITTTIVSGAFIDVFMQNRDTLLKLNY